jgi:hypothetical protein
VEVAARTYDKDEKFHLRAHNLMIQGTIAAKPTYCILIEELTLITDISQYRLRFGFSLLYTDCVPFELLDSAALL